MSKPEDLQSIAAEWIAGYEALLKTYQTTTDAMIKSWTSDKWSVDATPEIVQAVQDTFAMAGATIGLSRAFLTTAKELEDS